MGKAAWVRVTRSEPCVICAHPDYCTRSADGAVAKCMRLESDKPARGDAGGWIHKIGDNMRSMLKTEHQRKEEQPKLSLDEIAQRVDGMFLAKDADAGREELARDLGVSVEALELLGVGVGYDYKGQRFWSMPERDVRWRPIGVSRRYKDGSKRHMPGTTHGLYFAQEWWTMRGPILLPEGASDTAALLTMGLCAIGRPSNLGGVNKLAGLLRGQNNRPVIVIGENDEKPEKRGRPETAKSCPAKCKGCNHCFPGQYGARLTAERLTNSLRRDVYWRMVNGAKDSREWLKVNGADGRAFVASLKVPAKWLKMLDV